MSDLEEVMQCPICLRFKSDFPADYFVNTSCGHLYHFRCIVKCLARKKICPICNRFLTLDNLTKLNGIEPTGSCNIQPHSQNARFSVTRLPTASREYYELEITMVGDSGVGKTCLLNRYITGEFDEGTKVTIGVEIKFQYIQVAGNLIKLKLWDTSGQERYRCINQNHLRNSHGVLLICSYNMTNVDESTKFWLDYIEQYGKPGIAKLLVANMTDLQEGQRTLSTRQGQKLADGLGLQFYETSARDFYNVESTFTALVAEILSKIETNQLEYRGPTRYNLIRLHEQQPNEIQEFEQQPSDKNGFFQKVKNIFDCFK